jgi:hypothetical protein
MKRPSSLSQQVQRAQQALASWPDSRRLNLRLEGSDRHCHKALQQSTAPQRAVDREKK